MEDHLVAIPTEKRVNSCSNGIDDVLCVRSRSSSPSGRKRDAADLNRCRSGASSALKTARQPHTFSHTISLLTLQDYYILRTDVYTLDSDDLHRREDRYLVSQDGVTWFTLPPIDAEIAAIALSFDALFSGATQIEDVRETAAQEMSRRSTDRRWNLRRMRRLRSRRFRDSAPSSMRSRTTPTSSLRQFSLASHSTSVSVNRELS